MYRNAEPSPWPYEDLASYSSSVFIVPTQVRTTTSLELQEEEEFARAIEASKLQAEIENSKNLHDSDELIANIIQADLEEEDILEIASPFKIVDNLPSQAPPPSPKIPQRRRVVAKRSPKEQPTNSTFLEDELLALALQQQEELEMEEREKLESSSGVRYESEDEFEEGVNEDTQVDPDRMTYEQLLELGERMGKVEKGVNMLTLSSFPTHKFGAKSKENSMCLICQEKYELNESLRNLPCFHSFHENCIDQWLRKKKTCPVCLKEILHPK